MTLWLHELASTSGGQQPQVRWLTLQESDGARENFLRRLAECLIDDKSSRRNLLDLVEAGEAPLQQVVRMICEDIDQGEQPLLLVLDDFHLCDASALSDVQHILDHTNERLHLVLLSRTRPTLQVSRWQLERRVLTLGSADLSFDHDEFMDFARQNGLDRVSSEQLAQIERYGAGWAAGLQLIAQAASTSKSTPNTALMQGYLTDDLYGYVEHEILAHMSPEQQHFLVDISLLPLLSADLCAALLGQSIEVCAALLQSISEANSLITRYPALNGDVLQDQYRVHAVLRSILRRHLTTMRSVSEVATMRRRTVQWLVAQQQVDTALDLLLPATSEAIENAELWHDVDLAADLLQAACHDATRYLPTISLCRWLSRLPLTAVHARPRLALDAVWTALHGFDARARVLLQDAQRALANVPASSEIHVEFAVLRMICAREDGRFEDTDRMLQDLACVQFASDNPIWAYLQIPRAMLLHNTPGEVEACVRRIQAAAKVFENIGNRRGYLTVQMVEAVVYVKSGDLPAAFATWDRSMRYISEIGWELGVTSQLIYLHCARTYYLADRIPEARFWYRRLLDLVQKSVASPMMGELVRVDMHLCDLAEGVQVLEDEQDRQRWKSAVQSTSRTVMADAMFMRALQDMRLGCGAAFRSMMESLGFRYMDDFGNLPFTLQLAALVGEFAAGNYTDHLGERIESLLQRLQVVVNHWVESYALALYSAWCLARGERGRAAHLFERLMTRVEVNGMMRVVLDFPQLQSLAAEHRTTKSRALALRMQPAVDKGGGLTMQERRIMTFLADGGTARTIAHELMLSHETVRTHIKNIYRKLGADNRASAIAIARRMGMIE